MVNIKQCSVDDFENILRTKKIICFGIGKKFYDWCEIFGLHRYLEFVLDNYSRNDKIMVGGKSVCVIKPQDADITNVDEYIMVISTLKYAEEIIKQLDGITCFDGIDCYIPDILTAGSGCAVCKTDIELIPKKIHYFWFGGNEMPDKFKANIETWKKFCPDYEIIRWDENNYDITKCRYMKQAYDAKKWGFVPDYARLDIINTYGGIYFDTDVEVIKPFDDLLCHKLFCGFGDLWYVNFGSGFGGVKNNNILTEMMRQYEDTDFIRPDGDLNLTPSNIYQTEILKRHGLKQNGGTQENEDYVVYAADYFSPVSFFSTNVTSNTYSVHKLEASWMDNGGEDEKKRYTYNYNWIVERINNGIR